MPARLPNYTLSSGPRKQDAIDHVEYTRMITPKAGRGIAVSHSRGGSVISCTLPEAVRLAKATEAISAPTWGGTNLVCDSGSITFLKPYASGWTLGSETATAWNVMEGAAAIASGDVVIVSWGDGRWIIHAASC